MSIHNFEGPISKVLFHMWWLNSWSDIVSVCMLLALLPVAMWALWASLNDQFTLCFKDMSQDEHYKDDMYYEVDETPVVDKSFLSKSATKLCEGVNVHWAFPSCGANNDTTTEQPQPSKYIHTQDMVSLLMCRIYYKSTLLMSNLLCTLYALTHLTIIDNLLLQ